MQIRFEKIVEVEFLHHYLQGESRDLFSITPTAASKKQLAGGSFLFKKTPDGFVVLCEVADGSGILRSRRPLPESVKLSFAVTSNDQYYLHYSALPLETPCGYIYHLSNLRNNQQDGKLLLTTDSVHPFLSVADRLSLKPQKFTFSFSSTQALHEIEVFDELGIPLYSYSATVSGGVACCYVDLSGYPPGRFSIRPAGMETSTFYASDELAGGNALAVLELHWSSMVSPPYRFILPDSSLSRKTYTVITNRRMTYWKYNVVLKYRTDLVPDDLSIDYPDPSIRFRRLPSLIQDDGNTVIPFISEQMLPQSSRPVRGITLKKGNGGNGGIFEIHDLTNPPVYGLVPAGGDRSEAFSETYFYI
ncbi:MAG: hypothetical protein V2B20_14405 [Pseudomonadota bacterium]